MHLRAIEVGGVFLFVCTKYPQANIPPVSVCRLEAAIHAVTPVRTHTFKRETQTSWCVNAKYPCAYTQAESILENKRALVYAITFEMC